MGIEKTELFRELAQEWRERIRSYEITPQTPEWEAAVAAVYSLEQHAERLEAATQAA